MVAVVSVGSALGLSPGSAHAAELTEKPDPASTFTVMPMKRIGVNHEIAKANGYEVRVDSEGIEYAVKEGEITTFNEVAGECGSSWVFFNAVDTARHSATVYTGHRVREDWPGAVYTSWDVTVLDDYGVSVKTWRDPSTPTHFWAKGHRFTSSGPGWAYAEVRLGSIATLADGTICYSHGPETWAYL
jgi:hypothetical protein